MGLPYVLIKGSFHVVGFSPDGDSMMFKAENAEHWVKIGGDCKAVFDEKLIAGQGAVQLRLQGIDALETHYSPEGLSTPADVKGKETSQHVKPVAGGYRQPEAIGLMATEKFMSILGVKKAEWRTWGHNKWISQACFDQNGQEVWIKDKLQDHIPGYIVTSEVEKNGRPLAWVFAGDCADADGVELSKTELAERLKQSVNYQLLKAGLVYPYFFMTVAGKLRKVLMSGVKLAQASAKRKQASVAKSGVLPAEKIGNLWFYDKTAAGIVIADLKHITDEMEIYPYLFRKAVKAWYRQQMQQYWSAIRQAKPFTFDPSDKRILIEGLLDDGNPSVFVVSEQDFVKLSEVVVLQGDTLQLRYSPADLVFLS